MSSIYSGANVVRSFSSLELFIDQVELKEH